MKPVHVAPIVGPLIWFFSFAAPVQAQDHGHHQMTMPMPAASGKTPSKSPSSKKTVPAGKKTKPGAPTAIDHSKTDHSKMDMTLPMPANAGEPALDHSAMNHATMDHPTMDPGSPMEQGERSAVPVPPVTEADRAAAFPDVMAHGMTDKAAHSNFVVNRLETWDAEPGRGLQWEGQGWIGTDIDRLWIRSEGERIAGDTEAADVEILYGRSVSAWWDVVAGLRQDFEPGASQTWAAIGVMGLAPQKFEVAATAYAGTSGKTAARLKVEYELLLTNRLVLQPMLEVNFFGRNDQDRSRGAGLSTIETGLRLRYEVTRQFAPYLGLVRERAFGQTAAFRRSAGDDENGWRVVAGLRFWF